MRSSVPGDGSRPTHVHPVAAGAADIGPSLRARGMRLTPQRERVLDAVRRLGHATPEAVSEAIADEGGAAMPLSTVYRNLEALETVGVVSHTHLDHRAPSYHLSAHANHLHLVCLTCGTIQESPMDLADAFVASLQQANDFVADVRHMAIHGWCGDCMKDET